MEEGIKAGGEYLKAIIDLLSEEDRESFLSRVTQERYSKGQYVFMEEEPARYIYLVEEGILEVLNIYGDGRVYIHGFLFPGEIFGEVLLYGRDRQPYSVLAREDAKAWKIRGEEFLRFLEGNPRMEQFSRKLLGERLEQYLYKGRCIAGEKVERRIACVLLKLIREKGINEDCHPRLDLPLTNRDIAGLVGSTEETVSRVMSRLKKERVISTDGKYLAISDREKLKSYFEEL
jgi:CRP/FNR family transcriptional regulator